MNGNPLAGSMEPAQVARLMRDPSEIANLISEDLPGMEVSSAAIFADIINVHRADLRRLGAVHGVDLDAGQMTERKAASMLAGVTNGEGLELVELFNDLAHDRDLVLQAALDESEYDEFMAAKTDAMLTEDPETWDGEQ